MLDIIFKELLANSVKQTTAMPRDVHRPTVDCGLAWNVKIQKSDWSSCVKTKKESSSSSDIHISPHLAKVEKVIVGLSALENYRNWQM